MPRDDTRQSTYQQHQRKPSQHLATQLSPYPVASPSLERLRSRSRSSSLRNRIPPHETPHETPLPLPDNLTTHTTQSPEPSQRTHTTPRIPRGSRGPMIFASPPSNPLESNPRQPNQTKPPSHPTPNHQSRRVPLLLNGAPQRQTAQPTWHTSRPTKLHAPSIKHNLESSHPETPSRIPRFGFD